jgi:hypothetical protein
MTATFHELISLGFDSRELDVYDKPIGIRQLFEAPASGAEHHLIRYPEGMRARRHKHGVAHTIIVIEGALEVDGQVLGPGGYAHHPANTPMLHQPAPGHGALFVIMFDGPFDVTIVDD